MITTRHDGNGNILITIDDLNDKGDRTKTDRHITLDDAIQLYFEFGEALLECQQFVALNGRKPSSATETQNIMNATETQIKEISVVGERRRGSNNMRSLVGNWKMRKKFP